MGPVVGLRRSNACEYGALSQRCGKRADTTRPRPASKQSWHLCTFHAEVLDRIRESVIEHAELLARLRHSDYG